jgi:hypothetical protein
MANTTQSPPPPIPPWGSFTVGNPGATSGGSGIWPSSRGPRRKKPSVGADAAGGGLHDRTSSTSGSDVR